MKERIRHLLAEGTLSRKQIAATVGCSPATVTYHATKLGLPSAQKKIDWVEVQKYHEQGHSMVVCVDHFGFSRGAWSSAVVRGDLKPKPTNLLTPEKAFVVGKKTRRGTLKRLLKEMGVPYTCRICGISEWLGERLGLQLDHINGDGFDNRCANLRFLCPNCHSQTPTFSGRNAKKNHSRVVQ